MKTKVGVCSGNQRMQFLLRQLLTDRGYEVISVRAQDLIAKVMEEQLHLLLLDDPSSMLCQKVHHHYPHIPMIVLSMSDEERHKVRALNLGADDYVTKPFSSGELLARIRALVRRAHEFSSPPDREEPREIVSKDRCVSIALDTYFVSVREQKVKLAPKEFGVLEMLMRHEGKILTGCELLRHVWGPEYGEESGYLLRTCLSALRKKIEEEPSEPRYILTVNRAGYKFESPCNENCKGS